LVKEFISFDIQKIKEIQVGKLLTTPKSKGKIQKFEAKI
jgi:hypothetical protein